MFSYGCLTIYIIFALIFLLPLLLTQLITGAFVVLGFTPHQAILLMFAVLFGGTINIPVKKWPELYYPQNYKSFFFPLQDTKPRHKVLAVNVGGAIIPGLVSLWEVWRLFNEFSGRYPHAVPVFFAVLLTNIIVSYKLARPVENRGIAMPALVPPLVVAFPSVILVPQIAAVIAFPSGVLGVLIGADIMHLKDIRHMKGPGGSIGGAGTFDGIFLSGLLSVFLTS